MFYQIYTHSGKKGDHLIKFSESQSVTSIAGWDPMEGPDGSGKVQDKVLGRVKTLLKTEADLEQKEAGGKDMSALKNASEYAERLDKIADEIESISPEMALEIDKISDVIEGRREATTLKYDADEASYMAGRFNYNVRKREADEPYMDNFNKSNFEQVMGEKKNPVPIKKASAPYQKVQE